MSSAKKSGRTAKRLGHSTRSVGSPEKTAQMIAGPKAAAQAAQQGQPMGTAQGPPKDGQPGMNPGEEGKDGPPQQVTDVKLNAKEGNKGTLTPGKGGADSTAKAKPFVEEPWMAKLPPEYENHGWVWLFLRKPAEAGKITR